MEEIKILTTYIAAWMWQLQAVMFLIFTIYLIIAREYVWMIGTAGVILICEFMAYRRKRKLEDV